MKKKYFYTIGLLLLVVISCDKQNDWLAAKKQKDLVIPEKLKDFQAVLDQFTSIHTALPIFGLVGTDDFVLTDADFDRCPEEIRNGYIWNKNIWSTDESTNWTQGFEVIMRSNVVLDGLKNITTTSATQLKYRDIEGQAFFYRALFYYGLSQLFCNAYSNNADKELGLPLRLTSDVNIVSQRSSLAKTYEQIISDAVTASELLPEKSANNRRPSKAAAYAILAKTHLVMANFEKALFYAEEALKLSDSLLDFNSNYATISNTYRFPANPFDHPEIIFYAKGMSYGAVMPATAAQAVISDTLYDSYDDFDLRKSLFYYVNTNNQVKYRGSYTGTNSNFCGLATNELYLISAECYTRQEQIDLAQNRINKLLKNRYQQDHYSEILIDNNEDLLIFILQERRKELIGVGNIRWEDLKRLNMETRFQKTLTRNLKGEFYVLLPNSPLYTLPIPNNEIQTSSISQNER
ncbi:RagB/SusD family nutrient uptake outer membrane protein [Flavobacterium dauae]|uniref:RagB/SusD family nutrient uptake outer membrane protein n=1 Tax=Flavobacterium dauae TaxID=1563479 RepID=UPI00101B4ABC|nr:RagB/SusD family nutrient uptake outer membrane protein [Flavobacterium dauae]WLD24340.1 RagB/SusD family nutrient uptake outer membrane protein [Flavobacterium dauae]